MYPNLFLILITIVFIGCARDDRPEQTIDAGSNVYEIVLSELSKLESSDAFFKGDVIWVDPKWSKGDSSGLSWGSDFKVEKSLRDALYAANISDFESVLPPIDLPFVELRPIESFIDLHYYGEGKGPTNAKCLVQFWRAGFTEKGSKAIVRFQFGPSYHGAAGTFILRLVGKRWTLESSTISYYV